MGATRTSSFLPYPTLFRSFAAAQQVRGRHATHQQQQLGLQYLDLPCQERRAGGDLAGRRIAVPGRAPVQQVGDVDLAAVEADGRQHAVEKLAGGTDEGLALDRKSTRLNSSH